MKSLLVLGSLILSFSATAAQTCTDFTGSYRRVDDGFRMEWNQHGCESMSVTEYMDNGPENYEILTNGQFSQVSPEEAQKAFQHLNGKFVFSFISNDTQDTFTSVFTKTAAGNLVSETSQCNATSCWKRKDFYNLLNK